MVATDTNNIEQIADHPVIKTSVNPWGLTSLTTLTNPTSLNVISSLTCMIGLTPDCQHSGFDADTRNDILTCI